MGISPLRVRNLLETSSDILSLEQPSGGEHAGSLAAMLEDQQTPATDNILFQQALQEQVDGLLMRLGPRKQRVMRMRFGLLEDCHAYSLSEAGNELNVSRERIRQIEAAALADLREFVSAAGKGLYEAFRSIISDGG